MTFMVYRMRQQLLSMGVLFTVWRKWREYAQHAKAIKQKYAKFMQRFEGGELLRRAFKGWKAHAYDVALERYQVRLPVGAGPAACPEWLCCSRGSAPGPRFVGM